MKKILFVVVMAVIMGVGIFAFFNITHKPGTESEKIIVVTTLFPIYDFAKNIGQDKVEVVLLVPPGVEAHAYEPKPSDITKINEADIFVYTGEFMEPWVHDVVQGVSKNVKVVDASVGVELMEEKAGENEHDDEGEGDYKEVGYRDDKNDYRYGGADPHIWLDFENAKIMANNIANALKVVDWQNAEFYEANLKSYYAELMKLDQSYKEVLSSCETKTIIYGGHYAFGYLAKRYGLNYVAVQGFSPDSEPTAKDLAALVEQIKKNNIGYIFYEELVSPKIAETLARETGVNMLMLNGAHNITKEDYETGVSYILLMENNLKNLRLGLGCR